MYRHLVRTCGPQHWWPAETALEVIVGAVLAQNTSWTNVEKALAKLRAAAALNVDAIRAMPIEELQQLIRSAGYFRQKTDRLKTFVEFLDQHHQGSIEQMFTTPTQVLRAQLLELKGIGPETADSILLYAGNREVFVVDAYARRILERHGIIRSNATYEEIQALVERALRNEVAAGSNLNGAPLFSIHQPSAMSRSRRSMQAQVFNEIHGLFVQVGKHCCHRSELKCEECPLQQFLPQQ